MARVCYLTTTRKSLAIMHLMSKYWKPWGFLKWLRIQTNRKFLLPTRFPFALNVQLNYDLPLPGLIRQSARRSWKRSQHVKNNVPSSKLVMLSIHKPLLHVCSCIFFFTLFFYFFYCFFFVLLLLLLFFIFLCVSVEVSLWLL